MPYYYISIFYQLVLALLLPSSAKVYNFVAKNKKSAWLLPLIFSAPLFYILFFKGNLALDFYLLIVVFCIIYLQSLNYAFFIFWIIHIPALILLFAPLYLNRFDWFADTESVKLLILFSAIAIVYRYHYQAKTGIVAQRSLVANFKPFISIALFFGSIVLIILEFISPVHSLSNDNWWLDMFLYFITLEVISKIGIQQTLFSQLEITSPAIKIIFTTIVTAIIYCNLSTSWDLILPILAIQLVGAIYFEFLGLMTVFAWHTAIGLLIFYIWQIAI